MTPAKLFGRKNKFSRWSDMGMFLGMHVNWYCVIEKSLVKADLSASFSHFSRLKFS